MGGGTYTGLAVEMPGHTGTLREEGCQLPRADQGGLHPAVVSASASSIPFEIVSKCPSAGDRFSGQRANHHAESVRRGGDVRVTKEARLSRSTSENYSSPTLGE